MIDRDPVRLELTGEGVAAWRSDEQLLSSTDVLADSHSRFWAELSALCEGQADIDIRLSAPFVFEIRLCDDDDKVDVIDILAIQSPILPQALIWTDRHRGPEGHLVISMAKREWAANFSALLALNSLPSPIFRSASTQSVLDQQMPSPKRLVRQLSCATMVILIAMFAALALSTWQERQNVEAQIASLATSNAQSMQQKHPVRSAGRPGLSNTLARIPRTFGEDARLVAIDRQQDGLVLISIDTGDPDRLREAVAADPKLAGLREAKQSQQVDGRYRVLYSMAADR